MPSKFYIAILFSSDEAMSCNKGVFAILSAVVKVRTRFHGLEIAANYWLTA